MGAKLIPDIGEGPEATQTRAFTRLAHVTVGPASTNDVVVGDTNSYTLFSVSEPIIVKHVWTMVETGFTASVTLDIGDSDTLTKFISDTTINSAASGAVLIADTGIGTLPLVYATPQDFYVDVNGATVAAGLLHVYMEYALLED